MEFLDFGHGVEVLFKHEHNLINLSSPIGVFGTSLQHIRQLS